MTWDEWRGSLDGRPTLLVKHLFCHFGCHIDLHKMVGADDTDCFHTHPAYAVRVILLGGYVEELYETRRKVTWKPWHIGIIAPDYCHRVSVLLNSKVSYSLWIRFRKVAPVNLCGIGWTKQEQTHRIPGTILEPKS